MFAWIQIIVKFKIVKKIYSYKIYKKKFRLKKTYTYFIVPIHLCAQ